jgi:hypothetical protein
MNRCSERQCEIVFQMIMTAYTATHLIGPLYQHRGSAAMYML